MFLEMESRTSFEEHLPYVSEYAEVLRIDEDLNLTSKSLHH